MSESVRDASGQFVATYNEFVSRTCIEMCDESFKDEDTGKKNREDRCEEQDDRKACDGS